MNIDFYHVDAFTDKLFTGNPAAVCVLPTWLPEPLLAEIAKENALPVTAFLVRENTGFAIRWFTPDYELDLCGHGSFAAGYVIFHYLEPSLQQVRLHAQTSTLQIDRQQEWMTIQLPVKKVEKITCPTVLVEGLGIAPLEVFQHQTERLLVILNNSDEVINLNPNFEVLKQLVHRGIIVTATNADKFDFVSRTFYPQKTLQKEDAVTGASHCLLVPYWAEKLHKTRLSAYQASERGGELQCEYRNDYILLNSKATLYAQGILFLND